MLKARLFGKNTAGQSLVEILIALALITLSISAASILVFGGQKLLVDRDNSVRARNLAAEGLEAVRAISERGFNNLSPGEYGLTFANNEWNFTSSSDQNGILARKILIADQATNIKKIESEVSWETEPGRPQKISLVTLLTNWENVSPPPDSGDSGGGGISGDWQNPRTLGSVDLGPGNSATDLDVINKIVYMTSEASDVNKPDFYIINASNGESPFIVSSLNVGVKGLIALDVSGNYAYTIEKNDHQLRIINISDLNNPTIESTYHLPDAGDGKGASVFYTNNKLYVGITKDDDGREFHVIDVSNPLNPVALGSREINAAVNGIYVVGNTAYLAVSSNDELKILDVGTPGNITQIGNYDAPGDSEDGKSLQRVGNSLYLGRLRGGNHTNHHEFHIIDVSNSTVPQNLGSVDLAADLNDLRIRDYLAFFATSDSNKEFQVWNITNPANIEFWSSFNFPQVATGIDYENNLVYVSVRSNDALRIITSSP